MDLPDRINSFAELGEMLLLFTDFNGEQRLNGLSVALNRASIENPWFTKDNIRFALRAIADSLGKEKLMQWLDPYVNSIECQTRKNTVAVVMPGNIPLVGFHDFLSVLLSGNNILCKLSSSDNLLLPALAGLLIDIDPRWRKIIRFSDGPLNHFDAVIATGNDNTSRYFKYYFGRYPNIIRKNRNSAGILDGNESQETLKGFADDIMVYFGLGCRSVSKIYVPEGYDFSALIQALSKYEHYLHHHKYFNNYDYQKSVLLVSKLKFIDTGFYILRENCSLHSPVSVLNIEFYRSIAQTVSQLDKYQEQLQCIVCGFPVSLPTILPGDAQHPALWEYADQVDTLKFLLSLFS